jgi:hypothetical protein
MYRTLFLLAALCVVSPAAAQETPPLSKAPAEIEAPARIGHYVRGERKDYGNLDAGVAFSYTPDAPADSSWATVYYYRGTYPETTSPALMVSAEVKHFMQTLAHLQRQGQYDRYNVTWSEADTVRAGGHVLPGHKIGYIYEARGVPVFSSYSVYVAGRTLIKVRVSVPASQFRETRLLGFAELLAAETVLAN